MYDSRLAFFNPGPVEFDSKVLQAMATPATSHVDPLFINSFGNAIQMLRKVFMAPTGQPFVLAGSGTLGWDMTASNLVEPGENVLVVNTGIFGSWFAECLQVYGAKVDQVVAPFGDCPTLQAIEAQLNQKKYKMITITQVDTSSGVLANVKEIAELTRRVSAETLICVDGVCSIGAEELRMEDWGIDVALTGSQKAIGVPPGLALLVVSQRALEVADSRKSPQSTYFASFKKWLPIMNKYENRQGGYFATPPVQLIFALEVALTQILEQGMERRFVLHKEASTRFKEACTALGLKLVPVRPSLAANTLSAVYYPEGVSAGELLKAFSDRDVVIAGGLHPQYNTKYFRVGHMNISATNLSLGHIDKIISVLDDSLKSKL